VALEQRRASRRTCCFSLIPQLAGADLEVLTWISLLPLALVPLGVASSLLDVPAVGPGGDHTPGSLRPDARRSARRRQLRVPELTPVTQFGSASGTGGTWWRWRAAILLATLTVPARKLLLEGLEHLQYRERLTARRALTTFARRRSPTATPRPFYCALAQLLRDALGVERVVTYLALGGKLYPSGAADRWPVLALDEVRGAVSHRSRGRASSPRAVAPFSGGAGRTDHRPRLLRAPPRRATRSAWRAQARRSARRPRPPWPSRTPS